MDIQFLVILLIAFNLVSSMEIIHFNNEPKDTIVPNEGVKKVSCGVNQVDVKYSWLMYNEHKRTDQPVVQNQYISVDRAGVLILIHHLSIVGRYRCKASISNVGIVVSPLFRVDVEDMYKHKMSLVQLGNKRYAIGSRAMLICPFWTVPQSEYRWFVKKSFETNRIQGSESSFLHHGGKLLELEVDNESYGSYYCKAFYAKHRIERTSVDIEISASKQADDLGPHDQLQWTAKPLESLLLDRKEFYSKDIKVTEGKSALINREGTRRLELVCAASSGLKPVSVTWIKDGTVLEKTASQLDRIYYEIIGQGTLVLLNTTHKYNGEYTCKAELRNGNKRIQTSLTLIVRPQLRFTNKPAPIVLGDVNKEILLRCRINDADTGTKIVWIKNGELISPNNYWQQNDSFMRIPRLLTSDEGIFQCLADDEFSSLQAVAQMKISKPPSQSFPDNRPLPVRNLHVRAVSYRTLNISWNHAAEGFETILHYEIVLLDLTDLSKDVNKKITLKADRLESSVLVKNLTPDSFHRIFVSAVNGSGTSSPAVINSSPRVLSKAPSAAPSQVYANDIGSGVATIHWTEPPSDKINGELLGYHVVLSSVDGIYSNNFDVDRRSQMLQLSVLIPDTKYSVRIQALTRGGRGPLSNTITFDTISSGNKHDVNFRAMKPLLKKSDHKFLKKEPNLQIPPVITDWRAKGSNTSIQLTWSHPSNSGSVKSYKVKWGKVYPGPHEANLDYPTNSYTIENLDMRTQYMIKIIPVNDLGEGRELLFSHFTGNMDIKKIPIPLKMAVKNIGMDWAIISWEDPSIDIGSTRIYQVRYNALDKEPQLKNATENNVQISGLMPSTSYAFSVRSGDIIPPRDGEYSSKDWIWSEWSLKETFSTVGEKPKNSPQDFTITTLGKPTVGHNDIYTKVVVSWSLPDGGRSSTNDNIVGYTIFFTDTPRVDLNNWHTQILQKDQFSSHISLSGREKIYYFRIGCRTTHFQCPLSRLLLYKTADALGENYGLLHLPEKYQYSLDIPAKYLNTSPLKSVESGHRDPGALSRDMVWLIIGVVFGSLVFLMMLVVIICICCRRRSSSQFGYKLGRKSSNQHIGGAGLLLSNQSPAISNGKVSPHFMTGFNQPLKTPDLFPHSEHHFGDHESDSNQDNDSLRFASVSQHHLASSTTCSNMFNPNIQMRSHPQMSFYPDMSVHAKSSINSTAVINPLVNVNSISIPSQVSDSSLQRLQQQNTMHPFSSHAFTQHLINSGNSMPICSSSCMQPMHLSPHMLANQPHDMHNVNSYSNTPRVNASELASHTSSEDIRPLMHGSRVSDGDVSQYYGSAANSTVKSHKIKIDNSSTKKATVDSQRTCDVPKKSADRESTDNEVTKGFSTEELSQEMANLEGLMKDLNAITQKEFEC